MYKNARSASVALNVKGTNTPKAVTIVVTGATGTGKSTFINLLSGSDLQIGRGLKSCTTSVNQSRTFNFEGVAVTLIDTHGFDDTTLSDTDTLKTIASHLSRTYEAGQRVNGVIYMHRISDYRMSGSSRKTFTMFRKFCGDEAMKNTAIVTNMWNEVENEVGERRERELRTEERMFKPVLDKGAKLLRHDNSLPSAQHILRHLISNSQITLRIQQELVDEKKDITETEACQELDRELAEVRKKQEEELRELKASMEEALAEKDAQTEEELRKAQLELENSMVELMRRRQSLSREYAEERRKEEQLQKPYELLASTDVTPIQGQSRPDQEQARGEQGATGKQTQSKAEQSTREMTTLALTDTVKQGVAEIGRTKTGGLRKETIAPAQEREVHFQVMDHKDENGGQTDRHQAQANVETTAQNTSQRLRKEMDARIRYDQDMEEMRVRVSRLEDHLSKANAEIAALREEVTNIQRRAANSRGLAQRMYEAFWTLWGYRPTVRGTVGYI